MSQYWRLKKQDYFMTAIELQKCLPELEKCSIERIENHLRGSQLVFYKKENVRTSFVMRITLPLSFVAMIVLFIGMPINYIISGKWGYKRNWIANWFRSLGF